MPIVIIDIANLHPNITQITYNNRRVDIHYNYLNDGGSSIHGFTLDFLECLDSVEISTGIIIYGKPLAELIEQFKILEMGELLCSY